MADNRSRSNSSSDGENETSVVLKKRRGRPQKSWDAMSRSTLYQRLREQEQSLLSSTSAQSVHAGPSDEVAFPEEFDASVCQSQPDCEMVSACEAPDADVCQVPIVDDDCVSVSESFNFHLEGDVNFDAVRCVEKDVDCLDPFDICGVNGTGRFTV